MKKFPCMISGWWQDKVIRILIFDVVVPFGYKVKDAEIISFIQEKIKEKIGVNYFAVIQVDKAYCKEK